ncbi:MAG: DMT family transporter [Acetobacterales bacterium]
MDLWIPFTLAAAFMQNTRSALQRYLKDRLTTLGAAYVRFLYATPFAILYVWALHDIGGYPLPQPNAAFLVYTALGGLTQILFTALLLYLFSFRNFAVGTTFSKTEVVQIAVLGFLILGDTVSLPALLAILIALVGVIALSMEQTGISARRLLTGLKDRTTLVGLASGAFLGVSVVFFRGGALSLGYDGFLMAAAYTLAVALLMQTVAMGLYLALRETRTLVDVFVHWKWSLAVGAAGVLASIGWFTAFTLENGAYVRAVGQVELVFTFISSHFFFKERSTPREVAGILLIVASILILLLAV